MNRQKSKELASMPSCPNPEEITGHTYETISVWLKRTATHAEALTQVLASDLHLNQVEIDEFWSFVQNKRRRQPA